MTPVVYDHFLSLLPYLEIINFVENKNYNGRYDPKPEFDRVGYHNEPFFNNLHDSLLSLAEEVFKKKLKPSYNYFCLYGGNGSILNHNDRLQANYTIDYCINCDKEWDLYIDNKPYTSKSNTAIFYNGRESYHYRKQISGKFMNLVFLHYVPIDFEGKLN